MSAHHTENIFLHNLLKRNHSRISPGAIVMPSLPPAVFPTYFYPCSVQSQYSNIQNLQTQLGTIDDELAQVSNTANQAFQQASDGKTAIANAISGKGVAASASETFASLASKITNNLYKPPAYLSGTVSFNNVSAGQYSQHVTFSTAFGPIPKVTVATNYPDTSSVSAYNITRNGFDVKLTSTFSGKGYYTVTWTASA